MPQNLTHNIGCNDDCFPAAGVEYQAMADGQCSCGATIVEPHTGWDQSQMKYTPLVSYHVAKYFVTVAFTKCVWGTMVWTDLAYERKGAGDALWAA